MSVATLPPIRDADAPFCPGGIDDTPADLIIESSDRVHHHTHKAILAFSAHCFRNLLEFPSPTGEDANPERDGKPILSLPEDSVVMRKLLLALYPRSSQAFVIKDLDGIDGAVEAAKKYDSPVATTQLHAALRDVQLMDNQPHRIYAIACHNGLEDIAKEAAVATMRLSTGRSPFNRYFRLPPPEYNYISAHQLWLLENFQQEGAHSIASALSEQTWSEGPPNPDAIDINEYGAVWWKDVVYVNLQEVRHAQGCGMRSVGDDYDVGPSSWFFAHVQHLRENLSDMSMETVTQKLTMLSPETLKAILACPACSALASTHLSRLSKWFSTKVVQILRATASKTNFTEGRFV
ncbi:hypothetical protein HMN09_00842900 [Mycena chlorophos]|uniref:BTB domain-containing protein n=1 Tax=Mycena chlorophos TaxID=658473 RepID=A0A8H6SRA5_MYCCL|nr:hypothetical protein HMN09_00842900 [Mycena chlorophos]